MSNYVLIDEIKNGDCFDQDFSTLEEAIAEAEVQWDYLSDSDKRRRGFFGIIITEHPDPEDEAHLDGDVLWERKI